MNKRLNFGVISCSGMAQAHMKAITDNPHTALKAICDIDPERLNDAKERFGTAKAVADYREILADPEIDAVIIVTPDQTHREIAVAALQAGKHVLCEKPMALTMDDCRAMLAAAAASDSKMMIGQICRYAPGFRKAKDLVERGEIGELFFVETEYAHDYAKIDTPWRLDPLRHGFLGGGCHAVDLARWIAGDPTEVMAYSNHKMLPNYPTDDCTIAIFRFPDNVIGKVFVSTGCKRDYTMRSVFYGSKGTIITDNTSTSITIFKEDLGAGDPLFDGMSSTHSIPVQIPVDLGSHNASGELQDFVTALLNDQPVKTDAAEGAKTVLVSLAAIHSAASGMPAKIDYRALYEDIPF